jgi:hypothetical protein
MFRNLQHSCTWGSRRPTQLQTAQPRQSRQSMKSFFATLLACTVLSGVASAQLLSTLTFDGDVRGAAFTGSEQSTDQTSVRDPTRWAFTSNAPGLREFRSLRALRTNRPLWATSQRGVPNRLLDPYVVHVKARMNAYDAAGNSLYLRSFVPADPSRLVGFCPFNVGYCETPGGDTGTEFTVHEGAAKLVTKLRYNRILSAQNDEFLTLSFGIRF